jgi:hypothetical protein
MTKTRNKIPAKISDFTVKILATPELWHKIFMQKDVAHTPANRVLYITHSLSGVQFISV